MWAPEAAQEVDRAGSEDENGEHWALSAFLEVALEPVSEAFWDQKDPLALPQPAEERRQVAQATSKAATLSARIRTHKTMAPRGRQGYQLTS